MALVLDHIQVRFRGKGLFAPVTLSIASGEIATLMGPSGCGKSTLLSAVCGNLGGMFTVSGNSILNGRPLGRVAMEKRRVGILFQDDLLFPHFDVYGNLAFALPQGLAKRDRDERIRAALASAGLQACIHQDVATLSGGQKARVSLLRTLLAEPEAVLLDEPFSKLDKQLRQSFRDFVHGQIRLLNIPALLVTHDEADSCGGPIVELQGM
jgi:putative thiamine transport system ATP-binding protein